MVFVLLVSVLFFRTPYHYHPSLVGDIIGRGGIKMASANKPAKDLSLVHSTAQTNDKSTNLRNNAVQLFNFKLNICLFTTHIVECIQKPGGL